MTNSRLASFLGASLAAHAMIAIGIAQALPGALAPFQRPGMVLSVDFPAAHAPPSTAAIAATPVAAHDAENFLARDISREFAATPASSEAPNRNQFQGHATDANHLIGEVSTLLARQLIYPPIAREHGWEGTVVVDVVIASNGSLQDVRVRRGSGYDVLDRAAVESLRRIDLVAGIRDLSTSDTYRLDLPVQFRLIDRN